MRAAQRRGNLYVHAGKGCDGNPGNRSAPLYTIQEDAGRHVVPVVNTGPQKFKCWNPDWQTARVLTNVVVRSADGDRHDLRVGCRTRLRRVGCELSQGRLQTAPGAEGNAESTTMDGELWTPCIRVQ